MRSYRSVFISDVHLGTADCQVDYPLDFLRRFELAALTVAEKGNYDGFICGHIHSAGFLRSEEGLYCNDGDWVEHCTALVEQENGRLELLHWSESPTVLATEPDAPHPDVCGDARPVIDDLPTGFVEQVNRLAN